jgi:hypothetical protein
MPAATPLFFSQAIDMFIFFFSRLPERRALMLNEIQTQSHQTIAVG